MNWKSCLPSLLPTPRAGDPKTGCLLRWSLIPASYHGNLPGSGGHPSNPPGSHPDPEHTGECACTGVHSGAQAGGGWTTITVCSLLGPLHSDSLNPRYSSKGCCCPQFTDRKLGVRKALSTPGISLPLRVTSKDPARPIPGP